MPGSPHRYCVQHVWKNFIKQWKDKALRGLVWEIARCTTVPMFKKSMERLKGMNEGAWRYLDKIDPCCWVKAYFSHHPKCDNLTNNMAEVWNAKIVGYRHKPILTLCEELRCYIMRRMAAHQRLIGTMWGSLAPVQQKQLDKVKVLSNSWTPTWTGNMQQDIYEVSGRNERVGVNLTYRTCACNVWQLTGLPCQHAVAAISHKHEPVENFVHQWLTLDALKSTYAHTLNPVCSEQYWPTSTDPKPIPPPFKRPIGRPKKHRKRESTEGDTSTKKMKRTYAPKCPKYGERGHYAKTCKGPPTSRKRKRHPAATSVTINSQVDEIPLSQGGPAPVGNSQPDVQLFGRGNSPPPSIPAAAPEVLSSETLQAASSGTHNRLMAFMTTPGFKPPRTASGK